MDHMNQTESIQHSTHIKICGLRRQEDADIVNTYLPDYAGFILAEPFWRYITPDTAAGLRERLDDRIKTVGVFVNQEPEHIASLLQSGMIDVAQLHGQETDEVIDRLKELTHGEFPIWKALKITGQADVEAAEVSHADMVLLDGGTGSGQTFDWSLLRHVGRDYFLAGGLNPENAARAVSLLHPYGVDVSSGVETDKVKDGDKIRRFVEAVR